MSSRQNAKARAASAAGWKPPRSLSEEGRRFTATHPALYMHIWANFEGVHVVAVVDWLNQEGRLERLEIQRATWKPAAVSERLVVEWGARALSAWLAKNPEVSPNPR